MIFTRLCRLRFVLISPILVCGLAMGSCLAGDWDRMKPITPRGYVCGKTDKPLIIDGKLDEPGWQAAPWTEDFVDIEADRRPKPRQRTRAKMLWDAKNLYIAAEISEQHVQATIKEHDAVIFQDNDFEVFIDPDGDNHAYYEFEMNALNTTWDLLLPKPYKDGGSADNSWEFPGLRSAVHIQGTLNDPSDIDTGWSLEIAIPWSALKPHAGTACPPHEGDRWRIDFSRVEWQFNIVDGKYSKVPNTKEDNWVWSPQGIVDMHRPERWGFVEFTDNPPSDKPFAHDHTFALRDALMEYYHRQLEYRATHGRWSTGHDLQGVTTSLPIVLEKNNDGYEASLTVNVDASNSVPKTWHVRQDSKIWSTIPGTPLEEALARAGDNRSQLESALQPLSGEQRTAMEFLISNMPDRDLKSLSSDFLLENHRLAFEAKHAAPWSEQIPMDIFLNNVLPYANINEGRDPWRADFRKQFLPFIEGAKTPSQAAAWLNQKLFPMVKVKYSTKRAKADQSPTESIKSGLASCTGLSILLIDACRSVGIPARFVGTPLWSDNSGNHSWVEIWDDGWHFTGAAEPNGDELDKAWFVERASTANRDNAMNAIYAVSFQRTPLKFPLVWDRSIDYIRAVNVTDRYTAKAVTKPEGSSLMMFRVIDASSLQRLAAQVRITDADGKLVFTGKSKDEGFDTNDHLQTYLPSGGQFTIEAIDGQRSAKQAFQSQENAKPVTVALHWTSARQTKSDPIDSLKSYLVISRNDRPSLEQQSFGSEPLAKESATVAAKILYQDHAEWIRETRSQEMEAREIVIDSLKMPFTMEVFGEKPAAGRSLYISMHGGGGAPARVNTQQWENQKKLYKLEEGIYLVPRAPTDTWDLWHQAHIDRFFDRLIENLIVLGEVDSNRVYIMGYSAGGDGVYQLAPRMADRLAAAAMMAGHPNETSPLGLRNLPFTIHMGANDAAYKRNSVAAEWGKKLDELQSKDPDGYEHLVKLHEGKGHWMDRQDAEALPWMAKYVRQPFPDKIVWKQDDVVENRFYWLAVDPKEIRDRAEVIAVRQGQHIDIQSAEVDRIAIRLNDDMLDLNQPIKITSGEAVLFEGKLNRTAACIQKTISERGDPQSVYSAEVIVNLVKK